MWRNCSKPQTRCAASIYIIWNDPYLLFMLTHQSIVTKLPSIGQGWHENPEGDKPFQLVSENTVNQNWLDMKITFNRQLANSLKRREKNFPHDIPRKHYRNVIKKTPAPESLVTPTEHKVVFEVSSRFQNLGMLKYPGTSRPFLL